jgi:hypothetical protein
VVRSHCSQNRVYVAQAVLDLWIFSLHLLSTWITGVTITTSCAVALDHKIAILIGPKVALPVLFQG